MPVPIQQGAIADRLRRFARLVGRAGTTLDEVVTPVLNVENLHQPPYRLNPKNLMGCAVKAAVAASNSHVGILVPSGVIGVCVVRYLLVTNTGSGTNDYKLIIIDDPATGLTGYADANAFDVEAWNAVGAGVTSLVPPKIFTGAKVAGAEPVLFRFRLAVNENLLLPVEVSLRAGLAGNPSTVRALAVRCDTVNQTMDTSVQATWYPDAS